MWSELGHAYLGAGQVGDAIAAYLRCADASRYEDVIAACASAGCYDDLVRYLLMVRKKVREPRVDGELLYAYARINNLGELDAALHTSHTANLQAVGDRCVRGRGHARPPRTSACVPACLHACWHALASTRLSACACAVRACVRARACLAAAATGRQGV